MPGEQLDVSVAGILHAAVGVMDQAGSGLSGIDRLAQGADGEGRVEPLVERPTHDPAGVGIQHHRRGSSELLGQPDIGDVGHPELVDPGQLHARGQVQMDAQIVAGVGSDGLKGRRRRQSRLSSPISRAIRFRLIASNPRCAAARSPYDDSRSCGGG